MITANVLRRVFQVGVGDSVATAFAVDHNGRQYLVTAKHVVEGDQSGSIKIYHEKQWKLLETQLVGYGTGEVDIAVLAPKFQLAPSLLMEPTADGVTLGQDLYFLGFPYGLRTEIGPINLEFPLPLVKGGILSAMMNFDSKGDEILLIDGHNNPGFSGGPVVFSKLGDRTQFKVAGVVSAYRYEAEPIYHGGHETELAYRANTGIVIAYSIKYALELIEKNPIGVLISDET